MDLATKRDREVVKAQLGRRPRGVTGIPRRCTYGFPQVVRVHPVVDGVPFPTLYWLTCPFLGKEIDRLEASGWVGRFEEVLHADPSLQRALDQSRAAYIEQRLAQLEEGEKAELASRGMLRALQTRGIGGIAEHDRLKCLHLHVAHALSAADPIGERVLELLEVTECPADRVICTTPPN